jgi:hypothetical protein
MGSIPKESRALFREEEGQKLHDPKFQAYRACISPQPLSLLPFDRYVVGNVIVQRPPRLFPSFPDPGLPTIHRTERIQPLSRMPNPGGSDNRAPHGTS